jgi:hypothetical protein
MTLLRLSCGAVLILAVGCSNASHREDGAGGGGGGGGVSGAGGHPPASDTDAAANDATALVDAATDGAVGDSASDGPSATDWPFVGRRCYVVTSTLTPAGDAGRYGPASHTFTLVIDADTQTAIVGSTRASFTAIGSSGALRFQGQINFGSGGSGTWAVTYADGLTVKLAADGTLTGMGQGTGTTFSGDTAQSGPITASLAGGPDIVAPLLSVTSDGPADDPFSSLTVSSPEALPLGATPRLVADGFASAFSPATSNGDFTTSFYGAAVFRPYGRTYTVAVDGIADFAGHPATATGATSFTTRPAPPLVPEDGFESATGTTLGGAQILSGAVAIAGTRSLYIPATPAGPFSGPRPRSTRLAVRLAVAPGDTVVRFAYRLVSATNGLGGLTFTLASEGGKTSRKSLGGDGTAPTMATLPDGSQVQVGPIATAEIPLPADVGGEVVFAEQVPGFGAGLPPPPVPGVIIDDLRVE